jgi:hypothetical protein
MEKIAVAKNSTEARVFNEVLAIGRFFTLKYPEKTADISDNEAII